MAQKSSAKPAHTPSTLQLLPDLEFGKKDVTDLDWFHHFRTTSLNQKVWKVKYEDDLFISRYFDRVQSIACARFSLNACQ